MTETKWYKAPPPVGPTLTVFTKYNANTGQQEKLSIFFLPLKVKEDVKNNQSTNDFLPPPILY